MGADAAARYYRAYSSKVFGTLAINGIILALVIAGFNKLRKLSASKPGYNVRAQYEYEDDINEFAPQGDRQGLVWDFCFWRKERGTKLMRVIGLDGLVVVRFSVLCAVFCFLYSFVALALCCIYRWGIYEAGNMGLYSIQISNQHGPLTHFVAVLAAYLLTFILMILLHSEYRNFVCWRFLFFTGLHLDPKEREQRDYYHRTVVVERIPSSFNKHSCLRKCMEDLFPKKVEHAVLCSDTSKLREMVTLYDALSEDAEALRMGSGFFNCLSVAYTYGPPRLIRRIPLIHKVLQFLEPSERLLDVKHDVGRLLDEMTGEIGVDDFEPSVEVTVNSPHHRLQDQPVHVFHQSITSTFESAHAYGQGRPQHQVEVTSTELPRTLGRFAKVMEEIFPGDLVKPGTAILQVYDSLCRGFSAIFKRTWTEKVGFVTFQSRRIQQMAVSMTLQQSPETIVASRAAYPNDMIWENVSMPHFQVRVRRVVSYFLMMLMLAVWSAIAALIQALANLEHLAGFLNIVAPWLTPHLSFLFDKGQWYWPALNGFLPALALIIFMVMLPPIIRTWLRIYVGVKKRSEVYRTSITRCFIFNVATMYVTAFSGSFFQMTNPLKLTQNLISETAQKMDSVSAYFICYIFTKLGVRMAVYLLRPYAVLPWFLHRVLGRFLRRPRCHGEYPNDTGAPDGFLSCDWEDEGKYQALLTGEATSNTVEKKLLKEPPCFDWIVTDLSITLALCMMYGVIAPALIFVALIFFMVYATMVRYNFEYVYVQEYDSGGEFFFNIVDTTLSALILSLLMLQAYLVADRSRASSHKPTWQLTLVSDLAIPLLICIVVFGWYSLHKRYKEICKGLSLEELNEIDKDRRPHIKTPMYFDPLMLRARDMADRQQYSWRAHRDGSFSVRESEHKRCGIQ